jgi:hypothetical protein
LREEPNLDNPGAPDGVHDAPDGLEARLLVGAEVDFRLRLQHCHDLDLRDEIILARASLSVPADVAFLVNSYSDVFRLGHRLDVSSLLQVDLEGLEGDPTAAQDDDEQHQRDVHKRRRVDAGHCIQPGGPLTGGEAVPPPVLREINAEDARNTADLRD